VALPPRFAALVLVTPAGEVVGSLPPVLAATPWWQEVEHVVRAVRERDGVDITILRLLEAELSGAQGGAVTYLAEIARPVPARPWHGTLDEHPLRQTWARPGGPAADLEWADSVLADRGLPRIAPADQVRSWNLSSLWRLPLRDQTAWLKVVPPFFAHESKMLARLAGGPVPTLLGSDGARVLMPEIQGEDLYQATLAQLTEMVTLLVGLQQAWIGRVDQLLAICLPDWRAPALAAKIADVVNRTAAELTTEEQATLVEFVDGLEARFELAAACGLPDTLVHGDFFPGNARGRGNSITLLDWGDCGVGHPLLDQAAFLDGVPSEALPAVRDHWHRLWARAVVGSQPERAAALLAPVAAARQAVIYRMFLDNIEPSEHPYHAADPAEWLRRAAALAAPNAPP
jgi:hypothetical protein